MQFDFDFQRYVDIRRDRAPNREEGGYGAYAYATDLRVLRTLSHLRPARVAAEATVRAFKAWSQSDLLGQSVRVGPRQFPELHRMVCECAETLNIPVPTVYVYQNFGAINAGTFGTETDSFILINSATVDRLSPDELRFVIGHECGHIQNSHVTWMTALHFLTNVGGLVVKGIAMPATLALRNWSRAAEITCDRAGLLCVGDLDTAVSTMVRLAVGSENLAGEINLDEYLDQIEDIRKGVGRISEFMMSHPYLPKRVKALRLFAESDYYQSRFGETGDSAARPLHEIDRDVDEVVRVI